ncbi:hypothetical protein [Streptomyces sp. RTd22]|nr:hypothetical protein [Streptomyces sp. RTd22]
MEEASDKVEAQLAALLGHLSPYGCGSERSGRLPLGCIEGTVPA